jgi:hypothetical protein
MRVYFILTLFMLVFFSCKENSYVDGKKDGVWTEYLDSLTEIEVPKDSAYYIRKVKYKDGFPSGLISQHILQSNKLSHEFYLTSGPYLQGGKRPQDMYKGLYKEFNDSSGRIKSWMYFDDFGKRDLKKYFVLGADEISNDKRADTATYTKLGINSKNGFYRNPDFYDSVSTELAKTIKALNSNSLTKDILKQELQAGENEVIFLILKSGGSIDFIKLGKEALTLAKRANNGSSDGNSYYQGGNHACKWCSRSYAGGGFYLDSPWDKRYYRTQYDPPPYQFTSSGGDYCSARCASQAYREREERY